MEITDAKRTLYNELKSAYPAVIGAAIKTDNNTQYIAIYLSHSLGPVHSSLPRQFKGYSVIYEITGAIRAF